MSEGNRRLSTQYGLGTPGSFNPSTGNGYARRLGRPDRRSAGAIDRRALIVETTDPRFRGRRITSYGRRAGDRGRKEVLSQEFWDKFVADRMGARTASASSDSVAAKWARANDVLEAARSTAPAPKVQRSIEDRLLDANLAASLTATVVVLNRNWSGTGPAYDDLVTALRSVAKRIKEQEA